jgi:N-acetylmuramic acid 6-phosphate etherase
MQQELTTEAVNPASEDLDRMSTIELVKLINCEDAKVAAAVAEQSSQIAKAIDLIANHMHSGGRLVYVGAGTSGRLGVLDAAECPPTFNTDPGQVIGLIAGGQSALQKAVEGAEDSVTVGAQDLDGIGLNAKDVVVGIAASGNTPYVVGALAHAQRIGASTIGFSCNRDTGVLAAADIGIAVVVGPEVLSGSTRMKAGTATKMVLNMLTTGAMVKLGKTFGNLMVDLQATNQKLEARSIRILQKLTGLTQSDAESRLASCGGELKTAIVCQCLGVTPDDARARLTEVDGRLRAALEEQA